MGVVEQLNDEGTVTDSYRVDFFKSHVKQMMKAILDDGVNCIGYQTWAPIDILSSRGEMKNDMALSMWIEMTIQLER